MKSDQAFRWMPSLIIVASLLGPTASIADPIDGPSLGGILDHRLPRPATTTVEFARDIKPRFLPACSRCHGSETDRSGCSLATRSRAMEFALK